MKNKIFLIFFSLLLSCSPLKADDLPIQLSMSKYKLTYLLNSGEGNTILQRMRMQSYIENLETARMSYIDDDMPANKVKDLIKSANSYIKMFTHKNMWKTIDVNDNRWMK